jgi:ketosteroid isomerase-like protein
MEERAATLIRAIEAAVIGDASGVDDLFTEEVVGWSPPVRVSSLAELAVELEDREDAFSDLELEVHPVAVDGDRACVEWVASATHSGPYLLDDDVAIPATGRRVILRGASVADFSGDRIRSFRHYWDEVTLLDALGLLPLG